MDPDPCGEEIMTRVGLMRARLGGALIILAVLAAAHGAAAQAPAGGEKWVASWAASPHGPYPIGNATAQPELKFAFPAPETGAVDQTFRLIVKPDLWGRTWRVHFSNDLGTQPVAFDAVYVGLQASAGNLVRG